ncbi:MAG: cysteine synthase A [Clostridia bacterium]|nr:cysteine synthase A [Clostridia bacterium]
MRIHTSVTELIGRTPLLELTNLEKDLQLQAKLIAKLEYLNPTGSVKDRAALAMIEEAEASGKLTKDSVIIEPTSGNTGIGLASVAASRGYKVIIIMPDTMSVERQILMTAYGAELILTNGKLGMAGSIAKAEELAASLPGAIIAGQFVNPANPAAHYRTTGPEIWEDTDGTVDIFVAGAGTGGTITGTARYLKEQNPAVQAVAVEPADSPVLSGGKGGPHGLQGIGAGFIPAVMDVSLCDEILTVTTEEAYEAARLLAKTEGVLCGISSGAALHGAVELAKRPENRGKTIVVLLPDTGDRYLSTSLFSAE